MPKAKMLAKARRLFLICALSMTLPRSTLADIVATGPDDICAPIDDPCVITQRVEVATALLDFGTRAVQVTGTAGALDFRGVQTAVLRSGDLVVDSTAPIAIDARGNSSFFFPSLTVEARRACALDGGTACFADADCGVNGPCSVGSGHISLYGVVDGDGYQYGRNLSLKAAGDVSIASSVSLSAPTGNPIEGNYGGRLVVRSLQGSVSITGEIDASACCRVDEYSGHIFLSGLDVLVASKLSVRGWAPTDGLEIVAVQDAAVSGDFDFRRSGDLRVTAGRDIHLGVAGRLRMRAGGPTLRENRLIAGRDIVLTADVTITSNSTRSFSQWADYTLEAGRDITSDAKLAGSGNTDAPLGEMRMHAAGNLTLGPRSRLKAINASIVLEAGSNLSHGGVILASDVAMQSEGDLRLDGRVKIRASTPRTATFTGCRIEVGGRVIGSPEHSSAFVGREHIHQATGSRILTGSGTNQFTYRDPAKPPLLSGVVSPAPALIVDMGLVGCPVCGNDEVDQGETCDDGNTSSGDGCSDLCQTE